MKALLLALSALFAYPAHSQDSLYYAQLKNGQTIYSSTLRVRNNPASDKYLALDKNRTIPIDEVGRFYSPRGMFVTVPGSAGTDVYRVEMDGRKISLFSQVVYDPNDATYDPNTQTWTYGSNTRKEYYRKTGETQMHLVSYASLRHALSENPASEAKMRLASTKVYTGLSLFLASAVVEGIGILQTARKNAPHLVTTTNPQYPYNTTTASVSSGHTVSPLLFIGLGGMAGGIVLFFGAHHSEFRALSLYNAEP